MGSIYRRTWKDKKGEVHKSDVLWIKWYDSNGRPMRESAETTKETEAKKLLKSREGDTVRGVPITPRVTKILFSELCDDMVTDFKVNKKRSLRDLEMRLRRHVTPCFGSRRAAAITTAHINEFILKRQEAGASNGEINRELQHIKRAFALAMEATPPKALHKPHVPMLQENNTRKGFFERPQFEALLRHLSPPLRRIVSCAYITGWRVPSEILTLEWRQVDFTAGTISLDAGTTKNDEARVFYMTGDLRAILEEQRAFTDQTQRKLGAIIAWVFHRANGERIAGFRKAWSTACRKAGVPGAILHDFRRSAVRNMVRSGIPERVAMTLTGHRTRSVFERYNITSPGDLKEAARRLDQFAGTVAGTVAVSAAKKKR